MELICEAKKNMALPRKREYMPSAGRDKAVTAEQIFKMMESTDRPAWSAKDVGEHFDVSTPTAKDRLKELDKDGWVKTVQVSNVTAYYIPASDDLDLVERLKQDLVHEFTDKFVGLEHAPWTAVHPNDGPAEAGDKVQIHVRKSSERWRRLTAYPWSNRRGELTDGEILSDETQALISGELYAKPTTPIEHLTYPDDYDLEAKIGAKFKGDPPNQALIAVGMKKHWIRPVNNAVFLKNVSVDWISPKGEGSDVELSETEITDEMIEEVEKWRQEHLSDEKEEPGI